MGREGRERQDGRDRGPSSLSCLSSPSCLITGTCLAVGLVYLALGLVTHRALGTNAFDLSVFDYALWTTASGGPLAYVPMFRYSLFAQHFMPTLLLLAPLSRVFASPQYLIAIQTVVYAAAACVLYRFAVRHAPRPYALALTIAFLFSRRTHGAVTSYFYVESVEPLLIFGALLAWSMKESAAYWTLMLLAMGCKEDVAVYVAAFGIMLAATGRDRRLGLATAAVAIVWLVAALTIAIPHWRAAYGLDPANPFLDARYGTSPASGPVVQAIAGRLGSLRSLSRIMTVTSATGFLCFLAPAWFAVALPGIAVNLAAAPDTLQAGLIGHYLWPILPWLFVAAVFGANRVPARLTRWAPLVVVVVALIDVPLPRAMIRAPWTQPAEARDVRAQLDAVPSDAVVVAQPNLIPHMPRRRNIHSLGVYSAGQPPGDYVLLTTVGDLWPFDDAAVRRKAQELAADPSYEQLSGGPLWTFRRRLSR
jgi:uncharacterized membrane protein